MHAIPVLILKSPTPGLLLINGHAACEIDGAASLPVSNTGDVFLSFTPYGDYLPLAFRLSFLGGDLVMKDYPFQVTLWPDNIAEIDLAPRALDLALPGRLVDELRSGGIIFSLIRQNGFTLLIESEDNDQILCRLNMPDAQTGSLRELNMSGQEVVGALMDCKGGQRLLLFEKDSGGKPQIVADVSGDSIRFDDGGAVIRTAKSLGDEAGHSEVCVYERRSGGYERVSREYPPEDGELNTRKTARSYALAFTQALALGLESEALSYVSPKYLDEVGIYEMRMFLGAYSAVEDARYCPGMQVEAGETALALITYTAQNARVARVFAFSFDESGISGIKRYDPRGSDH